ncbi:unnamed protein product [Soboliphyme baturini]|uniref:Uncharacterized protein n=1 Tax=Soboliphyme baturini TaxID=241478 RepID=A0A3P8CDR0_9BILA|nr:unnamed protein product [Soboliphyme baturini]
MIRRVGHQIERICIVNSPVDGPFLTNGFYEFLFNKLTNVSLIYMRQLNLRNLNAATVRTLAHLVCLKKVIVHDCQSFETLTQEGSLKPALMCLNGQIKGLQFLLEGLGALPEGID